MKKKIFDIILTKIESFRVFTKPLAFDEFSLFAAIPFVALLIELAAALAAAAILPRVEMKRCMRPFLAGLI